MAATEVEMEPRAYCKLILHAAKYPHCAVNGILVAQKPKDKDDKTIKFVDCFPLFHLSINLLPMLEVALMQIDAYCQSRGLVIAGYYQGNEHYTDSNPTTATYRIADKIREYFSSSYIFMIDNSKMSEECDNVVYKVYEYIDGKWKSSEAHNIGDNALDAAAAMLQSKYTECLTDFDNHLDDICLDWKNEQINGQLEHYV